MSNSRADNICQLLESNWRSIASETPSADNVLDVSGIRSRTDVFLAAGRPRWIVGWDGYEGWLNYPLAFNSTVLPCGMPMTESILKQIHGLNFAALLILKSGMTMKQHSHPENAGLMTYHLGLDMPDECYLNADGQFIKHENGKAFSFDGTKPHYAFNASQRDRLILHCEVKNS